MSKVRGFGILASVAVLAVTGVTAMLSDCNAKPSLQIEVAHAVRGAALEPVPIVIEPGAHHLKASPGRSEVADVAPNTQYTIRPDGDFLAEPVSVTTDDRGRGYGYLKVIPLGHDAADRTVPAGGPDHAKWAEIIIRDSDACTFVWHTRKGILDQRELPAEYAERFSSIRRLWLENGDHRDPTDKKQDLAIVRVTRNTPFARIATELELLDQLTRPFAMDGGEEDKPVFIASVRLTPDEVTR